MDDENVNEISRVILDTFKKFGIAIVVEKVIRGCRFSEFQCLLDNKTDSEKIVSLQTNLEYALKVNPLRIVTNTDTPRFSIEVPRSKEDMVPLWNRMAQSSVFLENQNKLHAPIGVTVSGGQYSIDIAEAKHLLIGGTTGSGKSNLLHVIINSLLQKNNPNDIKFVLMDPKKIEFQEYKEIPHLKHWIVGDIDGSAEHVFEQLLLKLELRLTLGSNELDKTARIIIIIDELSDFMSANPKGIEDSLIKIAKKGHLVKMHLILSTSRPSTDVYTKQILESIPTHIAGNTSSSIDSLAILGVRGAEKLLEKGDLLAVGEGQIQPIRFQTLYISNRDIKANIKKVEGISFEREKDPDYFPVPDSIFWGDYISKISDEGEKSSDELMRFHYKEFSPDEEMTSYAELWIEHRRILSKEESNAIVFVNKQRGVMGGYYKRGWWRIGNPFSVYFINKGRNHTGHTEWEVTAGYSAGCTWRIVELDGEIISLEEIGSYII